MSEGPEFTFSFEDSALWSTVKFNGLPAGRIEKTFGGWFYNPGGTGFSTSEVFRTRAEVKTWMENK